MSSTPAHQSPTTGHQARWQPHNDSRRERIVAAAIELLEESTPGVEVPIMQIADRAGLAKSVVYRQFSGRDELDRRVRSVISERFTADLEIALDIQEGSIQQVLTRTVEAVVTWIQEHPRLREFLRSGPGENGTEADAMSELTSTIASTARILVLGLAGAVGVDDEPVADTMTFAIVSMTEATVTRWACDPAPPLSRDDLIEQIADYAWHIVDGVARSRGVILDPQQPVLAILDGFATTD